MRSITRLAISILVIAGCTGNLGGPPSTTPASGGVASASPVVSTVDGSSLRVGLPGTVATWAAEGDFVAYVPLAQLNRAILYDLGTRAQREVLRAPEGWTIRQIVLAGGRLAYVRSSSVPAPGITYEVGLVDLASGRDTVFGAASGVLEPNGGVIAPAVALSDALIAWSEISVVNDAEVRSKVNLRGLGGGASTIAWSTSEVAFARAVVGETAVVWTRPFGVHQSPTALRTVVVDTSASARPLSSGAANVEAEDQRVVVETLDGFAEIRPGLFMAAAERFPLDPPGVPALGRDFAAWCTESGELIIRHTIGARIERRSAPHCSLTVRASGMDVFWLQPDDPSAAITRVRVAP